MPQELPKCLFLIGAIIAWLCQSAEAQPTIEFSVTLDSSTATSHSTSTFTPVGTDRALLVCITTEQAGSIDATVTSVNFNTSEAFTKIRAEREVPNGTPGQPTDSLYLTVWYLPNPTTTTAAVTFNHAGAVLAYASVLVLSGASQSAPTLHDGGSCEGDCPAETLDTSVTTVTDNALIVTCNQSEAQTDTFTYGAGQVEETLKNNRNHVHSTTTEVKATAGPETSSVIVSGSGNKIGSIAVVVDVPTAPPEPPTIHYSNYTNSVIDTFTTLTVSGIALTGPNRGLAIAIHEFANGAGVNVGTVTFNGSESASLIVQSLDGERSIQYWYLVNPTATTADVVITLDAGSGGGGMMATVIGLSNVKQEQPSLFNDANCNPCTTETVNLTTTDADTMLLTAAKHSSHLATFTHGNDQTELSDFGEAGGGGERMATSYELKALSGIETLESTASTSGVINMIAIGVEPVPVVPNGATRRRANKAFK